LDFAVTVKRAIDATGSNCRGSPHRGQLRPPTSWVGSKPQMSQEFLASGGLGLFVMGLIWLALNQWLIQRLRKYHASTYEALGSPRLFANNSPRNSLVTQGCAPPLRPGL
jgi:hypothetical protein